MNRKTAKLLRTYCGIRHREKAKISLEDVKARYLQMNSERRSLTKLAMEAYLMAKGIDRSERAAARIAKARYESMGEKKRGPGGFLALAQLLWERLSRKAAPVA